MARSRKVRQIISGLKIALEYLNRVPIRGPGRNIEERDIAQRARGWVTEYYGFGFSQFKYIVKHWGAFATVHPRLWNKRVRPHNRISPFVLAVWNAGHGNRGGMPRYLRRSRSLTMVERTNVLNSRHLANFDLVTIDELYRHSVILEYLPEFLVCLGELWKR